MALVDLKTDLKSLKFDSGLNRSPFVVKDIDQEGGRNSGLAVQGILASKRIDDTVRMAKLVISKPGITHAAKQALIGFIGAAESKGFKKGSGLGKELLDQAKDILATAVTNVAQTPLNGLGLHLYKGILNLDKDAREYTSVFKKDALKRIQSPAHSSQISQGVKKSKKLTIVAKDGYSYVDYTKDPTNLLFTDGDPVNKLGILTKEEEIAEDIIPFYFTILGEKEDSNKFIQFRAFINSLSDSYNGMWNKTSYLGRPESFMTYNGFERQIQLGFIIAAETRHELKPMYQKLNYLASTTAPTFDGSGQFMRGTITKMTVGDYFHKQLCVINNVNISWDINYPWEIKLDSGEKEVQMLPHVLNVSITADAIHDFVPQTSEISKEQAFITNRTKDIF